MSQPREEMLGTCAASIGGSYPHKRHHTCPNWQPLAAPVRKGIEIPCEKGCGRPSVPPFRGGFLCDECAATPATGEPETPAQNQQAEIDRLPMNVTLEDENVARGRLDLDALACSAETLHVRAFIFNRTTELASRERELRASLKEIDRLREALIRAERKLSAYVGVCKGDKELTDTVLPMARAALAPRKATPVAEEER
jgi:hypothetical protein